MSPTNNKTNREYFNKLKVFEFNDSIDLKLSKINKKSDFIINEIKKDYPNTFFKNAEILIASITILLSIISFVEFGGIWRFTSILLIIFYFVIKKHKWNTITKQNPFKLLKEDETINNYRYVEGKVNYAENGIIIKEMRLQILKLLLILCSPFIALFIIQIISKNIPFDDYVIAALVSFILSIIMWNFVFYDDFQDLHYYKTTMDEDLKNLNQKD